MRIQLQDFVAYEDSLLWSQHRNYYQQAGLDAFLRQEVPYNVSSNPCLAAQTLGLLEAGAGTHTPLNVLEIGAGLGIFAYNFLLASQGREIRYWLSDFSDAGLKALTEVPAFARWQAEGRLRICLIDGENPRAARDFAGVPVVLPEQGFDLIVANYVYSTLPTAVLLRQQNQWLRQETRLSWLPLGEEPDRSEQRAFTAGIASALRNYRLVDRVGADQPAHALFVALQAAQEQVASRLDSFTESENEDLGDWLTTELTRDWAAGLGVAPDAPLRERVDELLIRPLLRERSQPPEQLSETHRFSPITPEALFETPSHRRALESLVGDWPLASVGYSAAGLKSLASLIDLCRPGGLLLLNDKAYADVDWMRRFEPEVASRHGRSLAHPVNFPLFAALAAELGCASRRTHDPAQALHSLLIVRRPDMPPALSARFETDFISYPRNELSHALLEGGHALMQAERLEQAERCLRRALNYRPGDGTLQYLTAVCLLNLERYGEALALLERPHDDLFGLFNREILMAESYRLLEQFERAIPLYQASLRHGENCQTYYNLALCQLALNQAEAARASLLSARELDPDDGDVAGLLAELG